MIRTTENSVKKPFSVLRGLLRQFDMTYRDLARKIGRSEPYVNLHMVSAEPWPLDECYKILDLFHISDDRIHEIFPRDAVMNGRVRIR